jgi:predicted small metal-binding protein
MVKNFKCADVGLNCAFEATANTTEQLMPKIADHARTAHGMARIPEDVLGKIKAAIKDV